MSVLLRKPVPPVLQSLKETFEVVRLVPQQGQILEDVVVDLVDSTTSGAVAGVRRPRCRLDSCSVFLPCTFSFFGGGRGVTFQTLCVASVTLLDGLAPVMLAWQAEPRCLDVKHTQNTLQPSQSASTVVVVLTSAHFVQTAMLSLTSHQLEQHAAGEPRKNAWKNASKEGSLNSRRRCETMLATRKLDNRACGPPMNANFGLLVHGE